MKKRSMRLLALLLTLVMTVSMLPTMTFAEGETATTVTATLVTDASTLKAGDRIVIAAAGYDYVMSTNQKANNRGAVAATKADDALTVPKDAQILTLEAGKKEGTFAFNTGSGYLYAAGQSKAQGASSNQNYLKTETTLSDNSSWAITIADGATTIQAQGENGCNLLRFYQSGSNALFSCYSSGQKAVSIYKLAPTRTNGVVTDLSTLKDGDKVVVFNPANGKALSSEYKGYYNKGVDVTLTDGVLSGYGATELWTLGITTADGKNTYTFSTSDGKKLAMGDSYGSMTLDAANSAWEITAVDGKENLYYIDNVVRKAADGSYQYRIQWDTREGYASWSGYNGTGDNLQQQLYLVVEDSKPDPDPTPDTPTGSNYTLTDTIAAGDTVVMYNAGSGTMLSSTVSGYKLAGVNATPAEGVITTADTTVAWTVGKDSSGNYTFTQGDKVLGTVQNGTYVNLSLAASDGYTAWTLENSATENVFYLKNTNMPASSYGNYYLEYYTGYTAFSSSSPSDTAFGISFYKLGGATDPDAPTISTIAAALAGETNAEFTVKGVVTLIDGQNIYLQDATGGICLRSSGSVTGIALGDTVIGTGSKTVFSGLPQLGNGTYQKSSGLTLNAKKTTIDALTAADICTYVKLTNVEVTEVYDNDGKYSAPNITVKDANGKTIQLYKAVIGKTDGAWDVKVGDKLTITAAVSYYQKDASSTGKFQLRNTKASEVTKYVEVETGKLTSADQLEDGSYVMIVSTGYAPLEFDSGWISPIKPVVENDKVTVTQGAVWTLDVNGSKVTLTDKNGNTIAPMGGNNNGIKNAEYEWEWSFNETTKTFRFKGTGSDTVTLASNTSTSGNYPGNNRFRAYKNTTVSNTTGYPSDFTLYKVDPEAVDEDIQGLPKTGDKVVIYNQNAGAVLAAKLGDLTSSPSLDKALATITDGKAIPENGAVVFTVEENGKYLRFKNETYGYLCSNGTGNNAFYSKDFSEEGVSTENADWIVRICSGDVGGFEMEHRTAKFNGRYSQWLEYYSDSFKTYSMYNVADYTIYSFFFYPVAESVKVTEGIVNAPSIHFGTVLDAYKGQAYTLLFTVKAPFGVAGNPTAKLGEEPVSIQATDTANDYSITIPAEKVTGEKLTVTITGTDNKGESIRGTVEIPVKDEPAIGTVTPKQGAQTGENKKPVISAEITNAGENPTVTMTVNDKVVSATYADGKITYTPTTDMADGTVRVTVTVVRADKKQTEKTWSFTIGESQYQLYFGQLHSHTQYSDGSGSLESALSYIGSLPESANVDFVAFTDHSNYFDGSKAGGTANPEGALYDMTLANAESQKLWKAYNDAVASFNESMAGEMVAMAGFEMTWSGGPGHINTFNTPGIVSRNNATLNNKTADAGMKAYYALLSQEEGASSISQFNHPGTTFGTFSDFAYWDAVIDSRMYMVEVGNGEGQIGAGGYYPSYEQYTVALDKGWHLAPTNNQDNHKGRWGNANDARDVVLTDTFTEEGIYAAIRALRMYATEDKNLEIGYTVNDMQMGSILTEVPEKLNFKVTFNDPDRSDSIAKVELVVNSGKVAYTWDDAATLAKGEATVTLDPTYSYYYVRITEGDGDLAVTAPVWVGESLKLGISEVKCGTSTPVTDEELTITTTLFNSEASPATVKSVRYICNDQEITGTAAGATTVPASGTAELTFRYTPTKARVMTVTVEVTMTLNGEDYTFTKNVELDVQDAGKLVYIGIDAAHYNEYVAGNYKDSMGNFSELAAGYSVRTVQLDTSADLIAACGNSKYKAIILTAPSRRDGDALRNPYATYSDAELTALANFNAAGGMVIVAGWSDHYEAYEGVLPAEDHMAAQQNKLLAALGSSLRISDDATYDDERSAQDGVDAWRLYFSSYNLENALMAGVEFDSEHPFDKLYTERFSHYGGASIYAVDGSGKATSTLPATVSPMVYGHSSTYSKDTDADTLGGSSTPKYAYAEGDNRLMIMATEQLAGKGLIVVSGAAFMSNFEVQYQVSDSGAEKNYSNYKICQNLVAMLNQTEITPIATVQAESDEGVKFTIEGVVTSNASGYDADTAFFDCIYVQDATAGINAFPVAGNYKIGDKVRITGTTSSYQGERQIAVTKIEKIGENQTVTPKKITAKQLVDGDVLGSLVTIEGTATKVESANGLIQTIMVRDAAGNEARVFIDGYITTSEDVQGAVVGCHVVATGLASYDNTFVLNDGTPVYPRIRIRDRADVVCTDSGSEGTIRNITYVTYGGTIHGVYPTTYVEGVGAKLPTSVTKKGYIFAGWYTKDGDEITEISSTATGDQTVYASWKVDLMPSIIEALEDDMRFDDVSKRDWFYKDVLYVYENGIMDGVDKFTFAPNAALTRAMIVTILYRMEGEPAGYVTSDFTDVEDGRWYSEAIAWAAAKEIVNGMGGSKYAPNEPVTREQLATILYRYTAYRKGAVAKTSGNLSGYADAAKVSNYATAAMDWAVGEGLINGSGTKLMPQDQATRAQVAAIIHRYLEG